jgi:hypothetical protein
LEAIVTYERWFRDAIGQAESLVKVIGSVSGDGSPETLVQREILPALNHGDPEHGDYALSCSRVVYESLLAGDIQRATAVFSEMWDGARLGTMQSAAWEFGATRILSQVFWRTEGGQFAENASAFAFTPDHFERRRVQLQIPDGLGTGLRFRLDPADTSGIAQVFAIRLLDRSGVAVWEWDGQAATLAAMDRHNMEVFDRLGEEGVFLLMRTRDPILLLPVSADLDRLSGTGGSLELDFAWRGTFRRGEE